MLKSCMTQDILMNDFVNFCWLRYYHVVPTVVTEAPVLRQLLIEIQYGRETQSIGYQFAGIRLVRSIRTFPNFFLGSYIFLIDWSRWLASVRTERIVLGRPIR